MTLREQLFERSRGYCEKCGWPIGPDSNWAMHHRVLQSRVDDIRNIVALHHECHNLGTTSVHLRPEQAMKEGFIVRQPRNTSPYDVIIAAAKVPVLLHGNKWVLLNARGTYDLIPFDPKEPTDG
jgi:hypothetical protein